MRSVIILLIPAFLAAGVADLQSARDRQDRAAIEQIVAQDRAAAGKQPDDANAQYQLALAASYGAEVATELRDKSHAGDFASEGMKAAEKAVALNGNSAEYHRILGTLCGQMVANNVLAGLKYGKCAMDEINKAIQLDPKSSDAYLSRGVGNYYLPTAFGGGIDLAIKDFQKAVALNPKNADAYLWLGLALRKANWPSEARKAFAKSLELDPNRLWASQQLDKTPVR